MDVSTFNAPSHEVPDLLLNNTYKPKDIYIWQNQIFKKFKKIIEQIWDYQENDLLDEKDILDYLEEVDATLKKYLTEYKIKT